MKGHKYRVLGDTSGFFKPGDIVVALENSDVPYCTLASNYSGDPFDKHILTRHALLDDELEEVIDD